MPTIHIRPILDDDRTWVKELSCEFWGSETVIAHGDVFFPAALDGFIAYLDDKRAGLITLFITKTICEVVTLNALQSGLGVGSALIDHTAAYARKQGCEKLRLVTTNDNTRALRFYQKLGFRIRALRPGIMDDYRVLKPEIPMASEDGIPIHDEIELELAL